MRIRVDHREQDDDVIERLFQSDTIEEIEYPVELEIGDYVTEKAIFEVKHTPTDYAGSMQDGRLQSQIKRMLETDKRPYVLFGFDLSDLDYIHHSRVRATSLRGFMASLMADFNVPIIPCSDGEHMADLMVRLAEKEAREKEVIVDPGVEVKDVGRQNVKFLCTIEGIGIETAQRIDEQFPTPASIITAHPDEVAEVDGVGRKTALKIINAFAGE